MSQGQVQPASPTLRRSWWALALRGVAAALFGLMTIFWPGLTLAALVILFGAYAVVDGAFALVTGLRTEKGTRRTPLLTEGVIGVFAGLLALIWSGLSAVLLLYIVAVWAVLGGLLRIATAILLRHEIDNEWGLVASGALAMILGIVLALLPGVGLLSLAWLIGIFALGVGTTLIWLSLKVKRQSTIYDGRVT